MVHDMEADKNMILEKVTMSDTSFIHQISKMLMESYVFAYRGYMKDDYLDQIDENFWLPVLIQSISQGDICLVWQENQAVLGCAVYGVSDCTAFLHACYLHPNVIGQGYAGKFYQEIETSFVLHKCHSCELEVLKDNQRAVRFYLQQGYQSEYSFFVEEYGMRLECYKMTKIF